MTKYKITIELDLDFEPIFKSIPEGLFAKDEDFDLKYYEIQTIDQCLRNAYLYMLNKDIENMIKQDLYKYIEHHNKCALQVSKQISENALIEIVKEKQI
jgi:hypothetical protein